MEPSAGDEARARLKDIRSRRSTRALTGLLVAVGSLQLMVLSFVGGYLFGPGELPAREVFVGVTTAFVLGVALSLLFGRRRLERGASWVGALSEGAQRRRVALFDDHVTVDREILVPMTVERADLSGESLTVRYIDPIAEGPVLREFSGPRADLARLATALSPQAAATGS